MNSSDAEATMIPASERPLRRPARLDFTSAMMLMTSPATVSGAMNAKTNPMIVSAGEGVSPGS